MKKLMNHFLVLAFALGVFLIPRPALAGHTSSTLFDSTTLNAVTTSVSGSAYMGDSHRETFFVHYTRVGTAPSITITLNVSYDNSTWIQASFFDVTGGGSLELKSKTITTASDYYFWLNSAIAAPYVQVSIAGNSTDATNTASVNCKMFAEQ